MVRTPLRLSCVALLLLSGCEVLTSTQLPASYSTASLYVLAGGTGGDDVWIRHESSSAPQLFHFDGKAWAEVPSEALKAAAGDFPTIVSTATAGKGALYLSATGGKLLRIEASGAVTDVAAGLPTPSGFRAMNRLGTPVLAASYVNSTGTTPARASLHRREAESWVELPAPPGVVNEVKVLAGGVIWVSGEIARTGPATSGVQYFASLEGGAWNVARMEDARTIPLTYFGTQVVLGPNDIWGVLEVASGARPWTLTHYDGTSWTPKVLPTPSEPDQAAISFGFLPRGGGKFALLSGTQGKSFSLSEWDGTSLSTPVPLGTFTSECILMCQGAVHARFLGELPDGTIATLVPFGRTVSVGKLPK